MADYALRLDPATGKATVLRHADGAWIPEDPRNLDWQAYQAWLADGGVPDAMAEPPAPLAAADPELQLVALTERIEACEARLTLLEGS